MARKRKKKALYEVIGRGRLKPGYDGRGEQLEREKPGEGEPVTAKGAGMPAEKARRWPSRPRIVQLNAGRIEISMPYQLAVAVLLGIVLAFLVVFRLGQMSYSADKETGDLATEIRETEEAGVMDSEVSDAEQAAGSAEIVEPVGSTDDNVIVLVEYDRQADLVPVQRHFQEHGIETEIVREGNDRYFLWTKERYENTDKPGTRGYVAKQRIKQIGALYKGKAPEGYEPFAPNYFSDAYGKKVK
jgi:hypothetical protein